MEIQTLWPGCCNSMKIQINYSVELCMNFGTKNSFGFVSKTPNFGRGAQNSEAGGNSGKMKPKKLRFQEMKIGAVISLY